VTQDEWQRTGQIALEDVDVRSAYAGLSYVNQDAIPLEHRLL
jgi:hypothetical protein